MRKTTLSSLLSILLLLVAGNTWAAEKLYYTLTAVKGSTTGYAQTSDVTINDMTWNAPGNQSFEGYWRIGGKGITEEARAITGKSAMGSAISRIAFNHNGLSNANLVINSMTLTVASDESYETILDEVVLTPTFAAGTAGVVEFEPTSGTEWTSGAYYKFTINVTNTQTKNYGLDMTSIAFYAPLSSTGVNEPSIALEAGTYVGTQQVTVTADEGLYLSYTLDGTNPATSETAVTTEGNTATITISESCTLSVVAVNEDDNVSNTVSATYVILTPVETIAAVNAAATATKTPILVNFKEWICTGVKGSNAYFTDGKNGVLLYQSGHGFAVGDILNGQALITITTYNDCAELVGLTATTEGVTVTKGEGATPMEVAIADLELDCQGNLITLKGVTYNAESNVFIDDDDNEIIPYGNFITLPTLNDGKQYDVTGVAIWYKSKKKWEIAPRTEDEIIMLSDQIAPESAWSVEAETVEVKGSVSATFTTNSDGAVTYASSNEDVATIDADGKITLVGKGITTITAYVAESETYLADSKSFKLTVTMDGYADAIFAASDEDIKGQGTQGGEGGGFTVTRDLVTLTTNNAYADSHIKIYGSTTDVPSTITLSTTSGHLITEVIMTATNADYARTWKDQDDNDLTVDGTTITWKGEAEGLTFTNQATSQARISTIQVTYTTDINVAIHSITTSTDEAPIYDLSGRRISKPVKGIFIQNGKKVMR